MRVQKHNGSIIFTDVSDCSPEQMIARPNRNSQIANWPIFSELRYYFESFFGHFAAFLTTFRNKFDVASQSIPKQIRG